MDGSINTVTDLLIQAELTADYFHEHLEECIAGSDCRECQEHIAEIVKTRRELFDYIDGTYQGAAAEIVQSLNR